MVDYTISAAILNYCHISNIRRTLAGNKPVDNSDVGAAPTKSSFSTWQLAQ